jgi:DNA helicase-2/ATP-dependent DNA helicase PcrA
LGLSEEDASFDPQAYPGRAVVATLHKAKGLEWDRVYILSVNNYDFPSGMETDEYVPEKWFIRDHLNLEAETIAQAAALAFSAVDPVTDPAQAEFSPSREYREGVATLKARMDYVRERLRLLYVGITRARKELIITWNTGRTGDAQPALSLQALQKLWR